MFASYVARTEPENLFINFSLKCANMRLLTLFLGRIEPENFITKSAGQNQHINFVL